MMKFVLGLALGNLALGYLTAVTLSEPPFWRLGKLRLPKWRKRQKKTDVESPGDDTAVDSAAAAASSSSAAALSDVPAVAEVSELPADWLAQLAAEGTLANSFVEAVGHAVRLEIGRYREQLVAAESRCRLLTSDADLEGLVRLAGELRTVNQDWLDKQMAAADMLTQRSGRHGDYEQAAGALEQGLLDQAALVRSTLATDETPQELTPLAKQLGEQIGSLLFHAHGLRDKILDLLATLIRAGDALETYGPAVQRDALCKLSNRIGLESLLSVWWRDDTERTRPLSAILINIDRFCRVNQRLGARSGDGAIIAVGKLLVEGLSKDRTFEHVARLGGDGFCILQGDTGPHQSLTTAERLRQAIEATTFDDEGTEFDLTVSCGVIEVKHTESSLELVRRANETLRFAKRAGRNRCALDKGDGPAMIDPPQFPVKARVVSLRAAALGAGGV